MFLLMLPLDKMMISPCHFCDEKGFSVVLLLQTELLALKEHRNIVRYVKHAEEVATYVTKGFGH